MSIVKWVHKETPSQFYTERPMPSGLGTIEEQFIPVVPLSALREVVEGLKYIEAVLCERKLCGHFTAEEIRQETQRLLASLGEQ